MNALSHRRSAKPAGAPTDADLDEECNAAADVSSGTEPGVVAEFGLLVLDNWRPPQTVNEAHALLANAKTLRALGEQTNVARNACITNLKAAGWRRDFISRGAASC